MGSRHAGTETRDAQVGDLPRVSDGDSGSETGDAQVGRLTCVVSMADIRVAGREI